MPLVWDVETITIMQGWFMPRVWDVETVTIMQGWCVPRVWDVETITILQVWCVDQTADSQMILWSGIIPTGGIGMVGSQLLEITETIVRPLAVKRKK